MRVDDPRSWCELLARGVTALRLNTFFLPKPALVGALQAMARMPGVPVVEASGWPSARDWRNVRLDQDLRDVLEARFERLGAAGDVESLRRLHHLELLRSFPRLPDLSIERRVVEAAERTTIDLTVDRAVPDAFHRLSLRVRGAPAHPGIAGPLDPRSGMGAELQALSGWPLPHVWIRLQELGLEPHEIVKGELGPLEPGSLGPRVTASLGRMSPHVHRHHVDDPLLPVATLPTDEIRAGFTHLRKWAVPETDAPEVRAWLRAKGSNNVLYSYSGRHAA